MIYFHNATLYTPSGTVYNGSLLVQEGKIAAIGVDGCIQAPADCTQVDASGLILAPGYIDLQFNGGFGVDFTHSPGSIYEVASRLPQFGVTAFLPTIITSPTGKMEEALKIWADGPPPASEHNGAQPLGYHFEGPMLNPQKKGAHNPAYILTPEKAVIENWSLENGVRLVTLAPELPGALAITRILRQRGVVVSAGHSTASYDQALLAFDAGVTCGTHLFNAMAPLNHRQPGLASALLNHLETFTGLIADGVHVHPAMIELAWKLKRPDHLVLVSDAMAALGMAPGQFRLGDMDIHVDCCSARLADGTLAGSILTLDQAVRNLVEYTGCSLEQAAACASGNPAAVLGLDQKGRLVVGMDADLVLLTSTGQVTATVVMGTVAYSNQLSLVQGVR